MKGRGGGKGGKEAKERDKGVKRVEKENTSISQCIAIHLN
jgi:hypothetical protein